LQKSKRNSRGLPAMSKKRIVVKAKDLGVDELLAKTQNCIDQFDYQKAQRFCTRALQSAPKSVRALELMGEICLELGEVDKAVDKFKKAIQLAPNIGESKYMSMGQLHSGKQALNYFKKGIEILKEEKKKLPEREAKVNRKISSALCSMTDVYLTDLCYDDDAEEKCCQFLEEAAQIDPTNPEVFQCLASVRISQTRIDEARDLINKSLAIWLDKEKAKWENQEKPDPKRKGKEKEAEKGNENGKGKGKEKVQEEEQEDDENDDDLEAVENADKIDNLPPYEFRISTAKLLLELEDHEKAAEVLELLLNEDDEVVEVWYLLGYTYMLLKERKSAEETLLKAQTLFTKLGCDDQSIYNSINELLEECKGLEYKPEDEVMEEDEKEDGDDDEWVDCDDDEEEEPDGGGDGNDAQMDS